jgi:hypothetical protein
MPTQFVLLQFQLFEYRRIKSRQPYDKQLKLYYKPASSVNNKLHCTEKKTQKIIIICNRTYVRKATLFVVCKYIRYYEILSMKL